MPVTELKLLEKTEIWVDRVGLDGADLNAVAAVVAGALNLQPQEVLVVDVRPGLLVLDVLRSTVQAGDVAGKGQELLHALGQVPGVTVTPATSIHSQGVLGLVELDAAATPGVLERAAAMGREVARRVARRALVFASGSEVRDGLIQDTNTPCIVEHLRERGFSARSGGVLADDAQAVAGALRRAVDGGFGLVVTTGGVGAEAKDCTIEGLVQVDPGAAAPWVVKYEAGQGRHEKAGVRVAVGRVGACTIACLPGPNPEVRATLPVLLDGLESGQEPGMVAEAMAARLRHLLRAGGHHPAKE
ncbi:MAG: molybdopterin-binding protein [Bacillota bacterium]